MPGANKVAAALVEESIRARQRRCFLAASDEETLQSLCTVDDQLDRNVRAMAILGRDAFDALSTRLAVTSAPAERNACVHLLGACAVQSPSDAQRNQALLHYAVNHLREYRIAVRDALWFYPAGETQFDQRDDHVALLLNSDTTDLQMLGVELAGRLACLALAPQIARLARESQGAFRQACELALARIGREALPDPERRIRHAFAQDERDVLHAFRLAAVSGQVQALAVQDYLDHTQDANPTIARLAWTLAVLLDARAAYRHAVQQAELSAELRLRIIAFCGFADDVLPAVGDIAAQPGKLTAAQSDLLVLAFGGVPAQARIASAEAREAALREQALMTLRHAHLEVHNNADTAPWQAAQWLVPESLNTSTRLRFGAARSQTPQLDERLMQVGSVLRQAFFTERGVATGGVGGLSAYGPARLQRNLLATNQWVRENIEFAA